MNLTISGHHLEVTPALREYVLTKLDRITRHFDAVVDVNVLLTVENLKEKERRQKAEVTLHVKGKDIFVEQAHEDLYAAVDQLMDKLDRQVVVSGVRPNVFVGGDPFLTAHAPQYSHTRHNREIQIEVRTPQKRSGSEKADDTEAQHVRVMRALIVPGPARHS